ncbi:MAG: glycerol kinase, partial [Saprospiraceae bacterium]|nr:glycerol kinase [Saprospiraceae bacterium]
MSRKYVLAIDQGTTSCRAILVDKGGDIFGVAQQEFGQIYPKQGWVEHDAEEILRLQLEMIDQVLDKAGISGFDLAAIGITNQRETTVIWDKRTGKPIHNAIVWQDSRTASICEQIKEQGWGEEIRRRTGLVVDAYFSGTKVMWLLDQVPGARTLAEEGHLAMGTIDTWLIWNMTGGNQLVTDYSNASRTMLYNIHDLDWDAWILEKLRIPRSLLPAVKPSAYDFGHYDFGDVKVPIRGVA